MNDCISHTVDSSKGSNCLACQERIIHQLSNTTSLVTNNPTGFDSQSFSCCFSFKFFLYNFSRTNKNYLMLFLVYICICYITKNIKKSLSRKVLQRGTKCKATSTLEYFLSSTLLINLAVMCCFFIFLCAM